MDFIFGIYHILALPKFQM